MITQNLQSLDPEQLRQAMQGLTAQVLERSAIIERNERELAFKQATLDKLTHEMAVLKRLKFAAQSEKYRETTDSEVSFTHFRSPRLLKADLFKRQAARRASPSRCGVAPQTRTVKLLVERVIVSPNDLEVRLRANGIERLVLEPQPAGAAQPEEAPA